MQSFSRSLKSYLVIVCVSLSCVILLGSFSTYAQDISPAEVEPSQRAAKQDENINHDSSQPVHITSDSLEVDDKKGVFVFRGNVVAIQDGATIYSEQLDVYYTQKSKSTPKTGSDDSQARSIEKIVARGAVRIVQKERIATGARAEYVYAEGSVVLTGSPTVVQGVNTIAGEKITVYLDDARSIVEGGASERVQATFTPDDDGDK